jgi:hypothetical protein
MCSMHPENALKFGQVEAVGDLRKSPPDAMDSLSEGIADYPYYFDGSSPR